MTCELPEVMLHPVGLFESMPLDTTVDVVHYIYLDSGRWWQRNLYWLYQDLDDDECYEIQYATPEDMQVRPFKGDVPREAVENDYGGLKARAWARRSAALLARR